MHRGRHSHSNDTMRVVAKDVFVGRWEIGFLPLAMTLFPLTFTMLQNVRQ